MTQEFTPVDTTVVQVRSVLNFMYALGYALDGDAKTGRFFTEAKTGQANRFLSVQTAVKLHNMRIEEWEIFKQGEEYTVFPRCVTLRSGFTPIGVRLAIASKLVEKAKISVTRNGRIVTQDVMVRPLNKTVQELVEQQA